MNPSDFKCSLTVSNRDREPNLTNSTAVFRSEVENDSKEMTAVTFDSQSTSKRQNETLVGMSTVLSPSAVRRQMECGFKNGGRHHGE